MKIVRRLCVAPMMAYTDRHFRYFLRLISRRVMLYTEMIPCSALLHGNPGRWLRFNPSEHPLGIQLGGSAPQKLSACARMAEDAGFDEINLNAGCPSGRVQDGGFGACLMAHPGRVADGIAAMRSAVSVPVTLKTRIGIDRQDSYENLSDFVRTVAAAGCGTFILHARKACLGGLNPRQNRRIPPLRHEFVHHIKRDFPTLEIIVNGGITDLDHAASHLRRVDGVMMGRAICGNPYLLAGADRQIFGEADLSPTRIEVLKRFAEYAEIELARGVSAHCLARRVQGLYFGQPGAAAFRRHLSELRGRAQRDIGVFQEAMNLMRAA